jgi:hypothetical protein
VAVAVAHLPTGQLLHLQAVLAVVVELDLLANQYPAVLVMLAVIHQLKAMRVERLRLMLLLAVVVQVQLEQNLLVVLALLIQ